MADETEREYDEFGEPIPTEEELAEERRLQEEERLSAEEERLGQQSRTAQTMAATAAMRREEESLPPIPTPVSGGRMYMGPMLTAPQEAEFRASPPGSYVNLVAPPTPEASAGAAARVAEMTKPAPLPDWRDQEVALAAEQNRMRFEAIQRFMSGDQSPEIMAVALSGTGGLGSGFAKPMTRYQQLQALQRQQSLDRMDREAVARQEDRTYNRQRWEKRDALLAQKLAGLPVAEKMKELRKAIFTLEDDVAKNPPRAGETADDRSWILGQRREALAELEATYPVTAPPVAPPPGASTSTGTPRYPDGTRLRKKDGSVWVVRNGVPVRV